MKTDVLLIFNTAQVQATANFMKLREKDALCYRNEEHFLSDYSVLFYWTVSGRATIYQLCHHQLTRWTPDATSGDVPQERGNL